MRWANQTDSGQNALPPSDDRWELRSETYDGIAEAGAAVGRSRAGGGSHVMAAVIDLNAARPGATPEDWAHFDVLLGLTADLLPVVSNPRAVISPDSKLQALGKTPSRYNAARQAAGIAKWTEHATTPSEIATWSRERDLGICLQTRRVRALDVDVTDPQLASQIHAFIAQQVGALPVRSRSNAAKFLVAFELPGEFFKRRVKCASGMVEFLATGQQFIAVGLHPSGVRYEWSAGLPDAFPVLSGDQFEALWAQLTATFGIEAATESTASVKAQKMADAASADAVAQFLLNAGRVKRTERDGRLHITCPFEDEHTGDSGETSTTYWPAHTGGYANGHFRCLHAHCEHRGDQDFLDAVGYVDEDLLGEFSAIGAPAPAGDEPQPITDAPPPTAKPMRFQVLSAHVFAQGQPMSWLVKSVLPKATLGVLFGESGAGKSFIGVDLAADIALGTAWRGLRTARARVIYVVAEGAGGFKLRLKALCQQRGIPIEQLPIGVIADAPNLLEKADALDVAKAIVAAGGADLVIVDTFAQAMPGGNENAGEDVGRALAHCKGINRATGAMVLLVHHSGKDATRGARGWSGLKAAADVELEVVRVDERRSLTVSKMKDGPGEGKEYAFRLNSVMLSLDADGDEITSLVVEHTEGGSSVRKVAQAKLGQFERAVVDAVEELAGVSNEPVPLDQVLLAAIANVPFDGQGEDRRRDNVKRAANNLVDKKCMLVRDGVGLRLKAGVA